MSHWDDRHLDFVLKHYQHGKFDTQKAIGRFKEAHGIRQEPRRRGNTLVWTMSAAAVLLLGVFLFIGRGSRSWTELSADAGISTYVLPDSTCVTLAPGATVSYRAKDCRKVRMSGKVFFDVTRDESRPFEVQAGGAFVRVLGTEFVVDDIDGPEGGRPVRVYVAEGKVLFAKSSEDEGVVLTRGMGAVLKEGADVPTIDEKAGINDLAWKRGYFVFDETPLKEVLTCLSEYYNVSFITDDLSRKLSGEFYTDDLDLIISLIESALDVNIIKR